MVYYLSGLTCTDENFTLKAGAQRKAAELGLAVVAPDTSPRGLGVEGEDESWDFGTGAGFYVSCRSRGRGGAGHSHWCLLRTQASHPERRPVPPPHAFVSLAGGRHRGQVAALPHV